MMLVIASQPGLDVAFNKAELSEILTLPTGGAAGAPVPAGGQALTVAALEQLLRDACADLRQAAAEGEPARAAAVSLLPESIDPLLQAIASRLATRLAVASKRTAGTNGHEGETLAPLLYEHAVEAVAAGHIEQAVVALGALLGSSASEPDGLLGLAVCAARLERYDAALVLATERLRHGNDHPRACCIAGLCELERGDRRAAQNYLAAAARLARHRPEYRDDLRAAQRLLIMMHFG